MEQKSATHSIAEIEKIGEIRKEIPVGLTARFLEHFSEQLYSSPNKAFEELLANSWGRKRKISIRVSSS